MGSNWSSLETEPCPDPWWPAAELRPTTTDKNVVEETAAEDCSRRGGGRVRQDELDAFKEELAQKRAQRHEALAALQQEMRELRRKAEEERHLRQKAEEERDNLIDSTGEELRSQLEKEREEKKKLLKERERLMEEVEEKNGLERQVQALKDVSEIGKEMLRIRELQVKELKKKLVEINISSVMAPPEDLRVEYEKQIENIRKLRTLYEERAAATLLEHRRELEREQAKITVLETKLSELQKEMDECKEAKEELEGKIEKLENAIQNKEDELENTKDDLISSTVQKNSLNSQMNLINHLFSQMLVNPKVDLDRLIRLLKENHGLITDLTEKGDSNEVAGLLVDLAGQVEKEQENGEGQEQSPENVDENFETQSEIASNLSKVWRVMVELLSHHQSQRQTEPSGGAESCYKCIQTPAGPRSVISVSQTFLTLKDLILEKNRLVIEVGRLKTLNNHLEHRLGSQEKRLSVVTTELRKTWGVVNKLRAQHKQLHTHEKILRYELQQKRCMLTELKQELEHCRDKWDRARQKNTQTEEDWKKLRKEFAARKSRKESNSAESGYEEEDVAQSPPSEAANHGDKFFKIRPNEGSEAELSEEEIEHSDGNSFDTVIDLLDIACLENQTENGAEIPFVLCNVPPESSEISPSLLPLTGSEFTEGLDQIESEDLAAVLDIQYQNPLLGADYNLSLPSSSGSSPIPTENDGFASSEMDVSEEDSFSNDNHIYSSPLPVPNQPVTEETLLFGSNSYQNIAKFLDGLFLEQPRNGNNLPPQNLSLEVPSTSQVSEENGSATPLVSNENCYQFPDDERTPLVNNQQCYEFPLSNEMELAQGSTNSEESVEMQDKQKLVPCAQIPFTEHAQSSREPSNVNCSSGKKSNSAQEEELEAREDKLKRLEKQCRSLVSKVMSTSFRSDVLSSKLDELHLCYGSSEEVSDIEEESVSDESHSYDRKDTKLQSAIVKEVTPTKLTAPVELTNGKDILKASSSKCDKSPHSSNTVLQRTPEDILEARAARLKRLEDQCKSLFSKMSATSTRSDIISNRLDELHESYGPAETNGIGSTAEQPTATKGALSATTVDNLEKVIKETVTTEAISTDETKESRPPDLASESKDILNKCCLPGPSVEPIPITTEDKTRRTPEEILEARAERFKRLEDQCKSLVSKMTATSLRSEIISNKLDELHSCYRSSEDASDNEEHSSSSREGERRRPTPCSSPRYVRKIRSAEKDRKTETAESQVGGDIELDKMNVNERTSAETPNPEADIASCLNSCVADKAKRTPEEILQARAQRLNRLEEQCKSLFSKMSATSHRSDAISNRLEELHEQYGQASSSENSNGNQLSESLQIAKPTSLNIDSETLRPQSETDERSPLELPTTVDSPKETSTSDKIIEGPIHNCNDVRK